MEIIIVGCGSVGATLAAELCEDGNDVTVIDLDATKVKDIVSRYDVRGMVGNGATHSVQSEAGIDNADMLIAVTESDELNLLCCIIAKKRGDCRTVARIKNPIYNSEASYLKEELGLEMIINPEEASAKEIARLLRFPSAMQIDTFSKGRVELLKFKLPEGSRLVGMKVKEVVTVLHCDILVCTVERGNDAYIVNGEFVFAEKDIISIIASPKNASDFFKKIDYKTHSVKSAMIIGAGKVTHYLCDILRKSGISIKIIEKDRAVCDHICNEWPDVTVINADASDNEVLLEEGIEDVGAFLSLTNNDEENILLSLFAKGFEPDKIVTKIDRVDYDDVINRLDLDSNIYPKNITSEIILSHARALRSTMGSNVETMYNVINGKVEASEFIIKKASEVTGRPLSELEFKDNILIAAILRGKNVIIPRGYDVIMPGDSVIVVSDAIALHDITDILR